MRGDRDASTPAPSSRENAQRLAERVVARMMQRDAFSQWLGIEVVHVAPDASTVRMTVRPEMVNGFGVCHGGVTFALADSALAFASNTNGRVTMSIENAMRYPASVQPGDVLTATTEPRHTGQRIACYDVTVRTEAGTVVGLFTGTVYRTSRAHFTEPPDE